MNTFTTGKGYRHLAMFLFIVYVLVYWSSTTYAQTTELFPSSMLGSLYNQSVVLQMIVYIVFISGGGSWLIEYVQNEIFKAEFSKSDIFWGVIGGTIGLSLGLLFPNGFAFIVSIIGIITLTLLFILEIINKK